MPVPKTPCTKSKATTDQMRHSGSSHHLYWGLWGAIRKNIISDRFSI